MPYLKNSLLVLILVLAGAPAARADSIWSRRDPKNAFLFMDYRARFLGDVLTIVVNETTEFEGLETRTLEKDTAANANYNFSGQSTGNVGTKSFAAQISGAGNSQRKFNGQNNSTIDRKFMDRMSVVVVDVLPNGNLVIMGYRTRVVGRELRTLRVTGIVRSADIGPFNTLQSHFIANFQVAYLGRGEESSYLHHGWWGRILNLIWPY